MDDYAYGYAVMAGDDNWRKGPLWRSAMAFLFGRRHRFEHLGMRCTIAWWKDEPFLISMREVRQ
ncbi:MAG: hypothetical protein COC12_08420 [Rhodobacteraceae bacterium]|nr:MAG: hypothetical protein COC12_08420 [Paracoccaceae bacterium]